MSSVSRILEYSVSYVAASHDNKHTPYFKSAISIMMHLLMLGTQSVSVVCSVCVYVFSI